MKSVSCTQSRTGDRRSGGLGVSFFDGSNLLATAPVSADGHSSLTTGFTTTGTHNIIAACNGDDTCGASNGATTVTVSQAPAPPANNPGCLLRVRGATGRGTLVRP